MSDKQRPSGVISDLPADLPLFRSEAREAVLRRTRVQGDVLLATPIPLAVFGILLAASLVGAGVVALTGSYTSTVVVPGLVQPEAGIIRAVATQGGRIQALASLEGAEVDADGHLATLSLQPDLNDGKAGALILGSMTSQRDAVQAQAIAEQKKMDLSGASLIAQRANAVAALREASERSRLANELTRIAEQTYERSARLLAQGANSISRVDQDQANLLSMTTVASEARSSVLELERRIGELDVAIAAQPQEAARQLALQAQTMAVMDEKLTGALAQSSYLVKSPMAGRILAVPVEVGQELQPGETVAILAPRGSQLVADLYVPSRSIGFVKPGQPVSIKYEAFPYQRFGSAEGTVTRVSDTVLAVSEIPQLAAEQKEPVFRVRVTLTEQTMHAYGREVPIQPGMQLSAHILIRRENFGDWLFDSIRSMGR